MTSQMSFMARILMGERIFEPVKTGSPPYSLRSPPPKGEGYRVGGFRHRFAHAHKAPQSSTPAASTNFLPIISHVLAGGVLLPLRGINFGWRLRRRRNASSSICGKPVPSAKLTFLRHEQ